MCPLESAVTPLFKVRSESSFQSVPKIIAVLADEKAKTCLNIHSISSVYSLHKHREDNKHDKLQRHDHIPYFTCTLAPHQFLLGFSSISKLQNEFRPLPFCMKESITSPPFSPTQKKYIST